MPPAAPRAVASPPPPPVPKEWGSVAADEPKRGGLKLTLIVLGILGGIAIAGGGYFVWDSKQKAVAEEKARVEHEAQLQAERDAKERDMELARTQREAEALARQASLEQALIEKEEAIRIANEAAAAMEAEAVAAEEQAQAALQLERDAKQRALQDASREQVIREQSAAIQRMLTNARTCLSRLNYSCVIANADNVLSFEPGNRSALDFKRIAEDAQDKATQNIRID